MPSSLAANSRQLSAFASSSELVMTNALSSSSAANDVLPNSSTAARMRPNDSTAAGGAPSDPSALITSSNFWQAFSACSPSSLGRRPWRRMRNARAPEWAPALLRA
eukprot:scaffold37491_cov30-Tisochrysis_lutea.AAC.3